MADPNQDPNADPSPAPAVGQKGDAPHPSEANQKNQDDASEADKRTIADVQKHQSEREKSEPEYRPSS